ncbi:MAG: sigma-70 family RNA polymerase sigma factor [Chloroflexota bacterium]|nr:sigma-70 family RNA polymerase sigma factor [Chloroflexota bacterium]
MQLRAVTGVPLSGASADDARLIGELRRGDEVAFVSLVTQYHTAMVRVAMLSVHNRAVAEEIVQETWLGVLQGLDRFEARSSLKTWIFRILFNRARTRLQRERRSVPFSALMSDTHDPFVDPERFLPADHPSAAGHWLSPPRCWGETPESDFLRSETRAHIQKVIATLPPGQQAVITLRDIEGWTASEVSSILEISEANQRVLLHRARSRVRQALEGYFGEE